MLIIALALPAAASDCTEPCEEVWSDADLYEEEEPSTDFYHGFRLGYSYVRGFDQVVEGGIDHHFVFGYELTQVMLGGSWLDVILIENAVISGLNQSMVIPSFNFLVGFQVKDQLQVGAGANLTPFDPDGKNGHMVAAVGYTPKAGAFRVPLHVSWIPDVDGNHRVAVTTGVNWR